MKNYYHKRKNLLHYLINRVEELVLCIFKKVVPNFKNSKTLKKILSSNNYLKNNL